MEIKYGHGVQEPRELQGISILEAVFSPNYKMCDINFLEYPPMLHYCGFYEATVAWLQSVLVVMRVTNVVILFVFVVVSPLYNPLQEDTIGLVTSFRQDDEQHVCSIYIYTDPFLWRQVYQMEGKK